MVIGLPRPICGSEFHRKKSKLKDPSSRKPRTIKTIPGSLIPGYDILHQYLVTQDLVMQDLITQDLVTQDLTTQDLLTLDFVTQDLIILVLKTQDL